MSGIIGNFVNALSGKTAAPNIDLNQRYSTGLSALQGGNLNLDPSIRNIQNQALGGFQSLLGDAQANRADFGGFGQRFAGLGQEFAGNQGALINARINPLRQQIEQGRGNLQRGLQRRGVAGSIANQDINNFNLQAGRQLGDAQALAMQDALNARTNLLGQEFGVAQAGAQNLRADLGFEQGLNQLIQGVGTERFAQELQGLGLTEGSITKLLGLQQQSAQLKDQAQQAGFENVMGFGGNVLGGIGRGIAGGGFNIGNALGG